VTEAAAGVERVWADADDGGELELLAVIVRASVGVEQGLHWLTEPEALLQVGVMRRPAGHVIAGHTHAPLPRPVPRTWEVLFIRSGRCRVDLYDSARRPVVSHGLGAGDVILLVGGGHGFTFEQDTELVEIRPGPWDARDKVRFD